MTLEQIKAEVSHASDEAITAYINIVGEEYATADGFEESYQGEYQSDEDFARETAESLGAVPRDNQWPMYCIDWEWAARELMMDYSEQDGHYFRDI